MGKQDKMFSTQESVRIVPLLERVLKFLMDVTDVHIILDVDPDKLEGEESEDEVLSGKAS